MENYYIDQKVENDETVIQKNKKLLILFSALAAFVPFVLQNLIWPHIFELAYNSLPFSSFQMNGIATLVTGIIETIMLVILVIGGYLITRTKDGTIRFCGIFMLSSMLASFVSTVFNVANSAQLSAVTASYITIAGKFIAAVLLVFINIKMFTEFEYKKENRCITSEILLRFRKKLALFLVTVVGITFAENTVISLMALTEAENVGAMISGVIISILELVTFVAVFLAIYLISKNVRNDKTDFVGFGASYYLSGVVTSPFVLLVTGLLNVMINKSGNETQMLIVTGASVGASAVTSIFSLVVIFFVIRFFFTVRDEELSYKEGYNTEQILGNLTESERIDNLE